MFSTSGELTTHSRTHSGLRPYQCDKCTKSFKTIRYFLLIILNLKIIKKIICFYFSQLIVHKRIHSEERPFACDFCSLTFRASEVIIYFFKNIFFCGLIKNIFHAEFKTP